MPFAKLSAPMPRSLPPKARRKSQAPSLPPELSEALSAARSQPENSDVWDVLDDVCRSLDRPEEAAGLYGEVLDGGAPIEIRLEVGKRAADFFEEWFEDPEYVLEVLRRVLQIDPRQKWAFERLSLLLTVASRWEDLLGEYDTALKACENPEERVELLEEVARVARDFAGESHRANDYLKELLLLKPSDDQLAASLERRLEQQQRHTDLIEIWTARLAVLGEEGALRVRVQIAERYLGALRDAGRALEAIDALLATGQGHGEATSLLERLAANTTAPEDARRSSLVTLEGLHTKANRPAEVVRVLEAALELAPSNEDRLSLHAKAIDLLVGIDRPNEALEHCAAILKLEPNAARFHDRARELATQTGEFARYAAALVAAADLTEPDALRVELVSEAAQVLKESVGDAAGAVALYSRVLADPGAEDQAKLTATRELCVLLVDESQRTQRLDVLELRAKLETQADRQELLGEAARIADALGDADRALADWALRLEMDAADLEALGARIDILEREGRAGALVADLEKRSAVTPSPDDSRADLVRVAAVQDERLDDLASAIATWKAVEERFGRNPETLDSLVALSERAERFDDVVALLEAGIAVEPDEERKLVQLGHLGDVLRTRKSQPAEAIARYREALVLAATDARSRTGLTALLADEDHGETAVETLADALVRSDEWQGLLDLVETRVELARSQESRKAILLEAARLKEQRAEAPAEALGFVKRAFALSGDASIEEELLRLAREVDGYAVAVEGYREALEATEESNHLQRLHFARGALEEEQLGRLEDAIRSFRSVLSLDSTRADAASALLRVSVRGGQLEDAAWAFVEHARSVEGALPDLVEQIQGLMIEQDRWDGWADALADRIASAGELEPRIAHDLKRQLAIWHRDFRQDADSAEFVLRRAVMDFPSADTLEMLAELQRRAPGRPLVQTLLALADVTGDALSPLREAAETALTAEKDPELATPILERALAGASQRLEAAREAVPDEIQGSEADEVATWSREQLVSLAMGRGAVARAIELLLAGAALPFDRERCITLRFRAAEAAATTDDDLAVKLCREILEDAPDEARAIALLGALYEKAGRSRELLELRRAELALDPELERRTFLRLDQARILGELGEATDERVTALQQNLGEAPGHAASVTALAEILEKEERFSDLADVLTEQADAVARSGESSRAAALWARAGRTAEERLSEVERALVAYRSSVKLEPSVEVLDRLAALCRAREEFAAEVGWLEQRLRLTSLDEERDTRRTVLVSLAHALLNSDEEVRARDYLEQGLAEDPAADEVRRLLARLYRAAEDWSLLAPLLADGVQYATEVKSQLRYLRTAAQVERRRLGNLDAAIPLLERAVTIAPEDRPLRLLLADGLRVAGRYDEARELLTRLLDEFGRRRTKERAEVHHHLAKIAQATGDLDEALSQSEAAANIERTDPEILMLLGQVARQKGQLPRAEQAYRTLLLIVSRKTPEPKDEDAEVVGESSILFELYGIAREMNQNDRAQDLLDSALEVATRSPSEAAILEEALRASGQSQLLLDALEQRLESTADDGAAAQILVTRAQVLAKVERFDEALDARLSALTRTPADGRLIDSTKKLADEIGQIHQLIAHMRALAEGSADMRAAGELWLRLGGYAEQSGDLHEVAELYERAQATGHKPLQTFAALDRVLTELGDAARSRRALETFVSHEVAKSNPEALTDALYRLAEVELSEGSSEAAAQRLERALEYDASLDRTFELLSPIAQTPAGEHPTVVRLFARAARAAGDQPTLLVALTNAANLQDAGLDLLEEAIALARDLGDDDRRAALLRRILDIGEAEGSQGELRWAAIELGHMRAATGAHEQAADLYAQAIRLSEDPSDPEVIDLELLRAELLMGPLGEKERAIAALEYLQRRVPEDPRVWQPLLQLYRETSQPEKQAACIEATADLVTDPEALSSLQMERIRLMIESDRLDDAEAQLRSILDDNPGHDVASSVLADLLDKAGRSDELRELLETLFEDARSRADSKDVAKRALQLAALVVENDRREAISVLTASLGFASDNREVLSTLLSLYGEDDDPADRADVMENLLALEHGEQALKLCFELVAVRESLEDVYGVGRALETGFKACPESQELAQRLTTWLRAQEDFTRLGEILLFDAEHRSDPTVAGAKLEEAALLYDTDLGDPMQAARLMEAAYEKDPTQVGRLERAAAYYVTVGEIDRAVELVSKAIGEANDESLVRLLRFRAATVARERGDEPASLKSAAADFERAAALADETLQGDLIREQVELLGRLRLAASDVMDEEGEREAVMQLARLLPQVDDAFEALETLAGWLREHPSDAAAAELLGEQATASEDWGSAAFAYARLFDATDGTRRRDAAIQFADAAENAGTAMAARSAVETAHRENPDDEVLRKRLRQLYESAGAYGDLAVLLLGEVEDNEDPEMVFELLCDAGDMLLKADDGRQATEVFQRALGMKPEEHGLTAKLADSYIAEGNVELAERILNEAIDVHGKRRSPSLAQLQHGLARVARARGDMEGVGNWLETALLTDRQNGEVASELALFAQGRGDFDTAIKALQLVTLLKTPGPMSKGEAYLRQAMIANQQGDAKKALMLARRAVSADPMSPEAKGFLEQLGA